MMISSVFFCLLCFLFVSNSASSSSPFGIQSSGTGSSFGGRFSYDSTNDRVFVTGTTYSDFWSSPVNGPPAASDTNPAFSHQSNCFFGALQAGNTNDTIGGEWLFHTKFGTPHTSESCHVLLSLPQPEEPKSPPRFFVGGHTKEHGLLTSLRNPGSVRSQQYGILTELDVSPGTPTLIGGRLIHDTRLQSVDAITADPSSGGYIFAATLQSDSETAAATPRHHHPSEGAEQDGDRVGRMVTNPLETPQLGSNVYLNIQKFPVLSNSNNNNNNNNRPSLLQTLSTPHWTREIASYIEVSDLVYLPQQRLLLVVGTARDEEGTSPLFGFVTLLDPNDGQIVRTKRLETGGTSVRLGGMCREEQPNDSNDGLYVVGTTAGEVGEDGVPIVKEQDDNTKNQTEASSSTGAVLWKLDPTTLHIQWAKQLDATLGPLSSSSDQHPRITGTRCAVSHDGAHVFVGGTVLDGAVVHQSGHQSYGQHDVWIGKLSLAHGRQWSYLRQLGTSQDDILIDLVEDKEGNVLVLGNTNGSFMRRKEETSQTDLFILSITGRTGDYPVPMELRLDSGLVDIPTLPPIVVPGVDVVGDERYDGLDAFLVFLFVALPLGGLAVSCLVYHKRREQWSLDSSAQQVVEYLKGFDDIEVDLQPSATGGWHGTYRNETSASQTIYNSHNNTSAYHKFDMDGVVDVPLFDDDENDEEVAYPTNLSRRTTSTSTYDGLIDAYNTTWTELSPHTLPQRPEERELL